MEWDLVRIRKEEATTVRSLGSRTGVETSNIYVRFKVFTDVVRRLLVAACVIPSAPIFVTLMKEAPGSSETRFLQASHGVTTQKTPFIKYLSVGDIPREISARVGHLMDRLCGLVVRLPGCRPRELRFDSRRYQIF
jgi:hypothetical protein